MQAVNQEIINEFLDKKNVFEVVGVSKESEKYGNKIYLDLKHASYTVYPVNPNTIEIYGNKCYSNLMELPILPDVVDIVVPPKITEEIAKECKNLGINKVWMQPGSESKCHQVLYGEWHKGAIWYLRYVRKEEIGSINYSIKFKKVIY